MCFITLFIGVIGMVLFWLGVLDRPKFQVVESIFGSQSTKVDADRKKELYAIVTTALDEDYIDNHVCSVLGATKKGIEAALAEDSTKGAGEITITSSYTVTGYPSSKPKKGAGDIITPHEDDNIGISVFLQDPATGECHENAVGFFVGASSFEEAKKFASKVAKTVRADLSRTDTPGLDDTECSLSGGMGSSSSSSDRSSKEKMTAEEFQVHAVSLGNGAVFRGRIPMRSRLAFLLARYLHWGRAHTEYTELMTSQEESDDAKVGAVACEIYVNGQHNPALQSVYADYLYLLDPRDRQMVWEHLDTPMPK
ncbi:expressed unknown protein [Seminavis robusta]|uniref:Uncharacterized protein n=1 Tax=Seminavis robusta TaxID=568900 RepID=A0A9N8HAM3_9STRA|nr:expressed unknown protein [Seminavis robusta]|eukprot:Sro247_g097950.1 n/a (310) ;mRNA; r:4530-5459